MDALKPEKLDKRITAASEDENSFGHSDNWERFQKVTNVILNRAKGIPIIILGALPSTQRFRNKKPLYC